MLKQLLISLIGEIEPYLTAITDEAGNITDYVYTLDVAWICSFLIFAVIIYCLFRLGGVLLGGR